MSLKSVPGLALVFNNTEAVYSKSGGTTKVSKFITINLPASSICFLPSNKACFKVSSDKAPSIKLSPLAVIAVPSAFFFSTNGCSCENNGCPS